MVCWALGVGGVRGCILGKGMGKGGERFLCGCQAMVWRVFVRGVDGGRWSPGYGIVD